MDDRRSSRRTPTILEGRILIDDQTAHIECTVRNVSETGAQIWFPHTITLPPEFDLDIPKRGQSDRARLMWSKGKSHGVMFIQKQPEDTYAEGSSAHAAPHVQKILNDACGQLAQALGIPADRIRLKLEIEPQ